MSALLYQILVLLIATLPISLFCVRFINKHMLKDNENLADIGSICTDVLGTLTKKDLEIRELHFDHYNFEISEKNSPLTEEQILTIKKNPNIYFISKISNLCHYHKVHRLEQTTTHFFRKFGFQKSEIDQNFHIVEKIKTSSEKKMSSVVIKDNESKDYYTYAKGNPYIILQKCKRILLEGRKQELDKSTRGRLQNRFKKMRQKGFKIIAFAYKGLPKKRMERYTEEFCENDLVFLGFIAFGNALNPDLKGQIETIKKMGIKIYVIAKSEEKRSISAGLELGIINPNYFEALNKNDLQDVNDEKIMKMLQNEEKDYIFTEMETADKNRIIDLLKKKNKKLKVLNAETHFDFQKLIEKIEISKKHKNNFPKIQTHDRAVRFSIIALTLSTLFLKTPPLFTIGSLFFLEIFVNVPLALAIQNAENSNKQKNHSDIILSILIVALAYFNFWRYDYLPAPLNFNLPSVSQASLETSTSVIITLILLQALHALYLQETITKKYLFTLIGLLTLLVYALIALKDLQTTLQLTELPLEDWKIIGLTIISFLLIIEFIPQFLKKNPTTNEQINITSKNQ